MRKNRLKSRFNWQSLHSERGDLEAMGPVLSSRILFNLLLINEFEQAVLRLKNEDCVWGPVHSSIGQEAVAAAAIAALKRGDLIGGSHRAHHQFLAKALGFVLQDGWNPAKNDLPEVAQEVVRRTLAEIMGLAPGYCGGRGGSMHLRYAEAGVLGTSAIVGGGIPVATGAAYAQKRMRSGSVVVCFFGDGAVNQGSFHEACNLAGLWRLPIVYFVENNLYAVGTKADKACAVKDLSLRASSYAMDGFIVEGHDVPALYQTVKEAVDGIRKGNPPCIIEAKCYRHFHHAGDQPGSAYGYRDRREEEEWLARDAVKTYPEALLEAGTLERKDIERLKSMARESVFRAVAACTSGETPVAVRSELWPAPGQALTGLRSSGQELSGIDYREQEDFGSFSQIAYSDAIAAVTGRWLERDERVFELGEEVANFGGGPYGATKSLPEKYPDRIVNTPISEAGFIGLACGAALSGMRPIVEIMFPDFSLVAADQLFNQIAKARHMYGGESDLPLVARTRIATGCGYGAQHSMDPVGLFALFPGWRIVAPSNAFDYIGLFNTSMKSLDPVLIMEHHSLYRKTFPIPEDNMDYFVPFGKARLMASGTDITLIAYGAMAERLRALGTELERRGISADILDLRSVDLPSIDYPAIGESVQKTGAVAVVEEAPASMGIGHHIAAQITERFYDELDGPPGCINSADVPPPVSRVLEESVLLQDQRILDITEAISERRWR